MTTEEMNADVTAAAYAELWRQEKAECERLRGILQGLLDLKSRKENLLATLRHEDRKRDLWASARTALAANLEKDEP